jgi:hypothetical protein
VNKKSKVIKKLKKKTLWVNTMNYVFFSMLYFHHLFLFLFFILSHNTLTIHDLKYHFMVCGVLIL